MLSIILTVFYLILTWLMLAQSYGLTDIRDCPLDIDLASISTSNLSYGKFPESSRTKQSYQPNNNQSYQSNQYLT